MPTKKRMKNSSKTSIHPNPDVRARARAYRPTGREVNPLEVMLDRAIKRRDHELKEELLALAKSGAPKPRRGTRLGDALIRFTTPPTTRKTSARRTKLSEMDRLQVAASGIKRQRPNYLAKGERRTD